jgi:NAD(P)-dependent dehydrogenase (short-subunit alcohol dehydrogenase family)
MEYYTRQYARMLAPKGITVNVVVPGHVLTSAWGAGFQIPGGQSSLLEWIKQRSPMNRPIEVEEVANTVAFLASLKAGAITGQALLCDGGLSSFT